MITPECHSAHSQVHTAWYEFFATSLQQHPTQWSRMRLPQTVVSNYSSKRIHDPQDETCERVVLFSLYHHGLVWFGGTLNPKSGYNFNTIVGRWISSREEMQLLSRSWCTQNVNMKTKWWRHKPAATQGQSETWPYKTAEFVDKENNEVNNSNFTMCIRVEQCIKLCPNPLVSHIWCVSCRLHQVKSFSTMTLGTKASNVNTSHLPPVMPGAYRESQFLFSGPPM